MKYLILKITNRCNLNCIYCYANNKNDKDMDFKTAKRSIDYLLNLDDKLKIQFTGGEPLLNFKLIEKVVKYCNETYPNKTITYAIQTNATLLDKKLVERIKDLNLNVGVSIDGLEVNDHLRPYKDGKSSTLDTLKGIYLLNSYNIKFGITSVITSYNLPYLKDFVKYLLAVGIRSVSFDLLKPKKEDHLKLLPNLEEFKKILDELKNYPIFIKNLQKRPNRGYCYLNFGDMLFVNEYGDIYPCPTLEGFFYVGNVSEGIKLPKIECNKCYAREFLMSMWNKNDGIRNKKRENK
ncbi:radical SAM protein [Methanocaldococcus sp.]